MTLLPAINQLKVKRLGIDTQWEYVIYLNAHCAICRSEGLESLTRIQIFYQEKSIIATLNVLYGTNLLTEKVY